MVAGLSHGAVDFERGLDNNKNMNKVNVCGLSQKVNHGHSYTNGNTGVSVP